MNPQSPGTGVILTAGGFVDPANEGVREDLQMYYCFTNDRIQVFNKTDDRMAEATLAAQVNLDDLRRSTPVQRIERVLSCEYQTNPVLIIAAATLDLNHVLFWFDVRSQALHLVALDEPLVGEISAFHVMQAPMTVRAEQSRTNVLRHVLAVGMQNGSIRIVMMEYPIQERVQTTAMWVQAADLDESPVTALALVPPAKNKPLGAHFCYDPRLLVGTMKGLLVSLTIHQASYITVNPPYRMKANIAYATEPITQIKAFRDPRRQSKCVLAVGQDSSRDAERTNKTGVEKQACVNIIEHYGNNKRKCLFSIRPGALQNATSIMAMRLLPNPISGYSFTAAFCSREGNEINIISYSIFKEERTVKARLSMDRCEEDHGWLWDVYPYENNYLALTGEPLAQPSDSGSETRDSRVILFRSDGTSSQEDMTYHSSDEHEHSRATSIESSMDLDQEESDTEPDMVEDASVPEQNEPPASVEDEETALAQLQETATAQSAINDILATEEVSTETIEEYTIESRAESTTGTREISSRTPTVLAAQDIDDELQRFEEDAANLQDVAMAEAENLEASDATLAELFMLETEDVETHVEQENIEAHTTQEDVEAQVVHDLETQLEQESVEAYPDQPNIDADIKPEDVEERIEHEDVAAQSEHESVEAQGACGDVEAQSGHEDSKEQNVPEGVETQIGHEDVEAQTVPEDVETRAVQGDVEVHVEREEIHVDTEQEYMDASQYDNYDDYDDYHDNASTQYHDGAETLHYDTREDIREDVEPQTLTESYNTPSSTREEEHAGILDTSHQEESPNTTETGEQVLHREVPVEEQRNSDIEQSGDTQQDSEIQSKEEVENVESDTEQLRLSHPEEHRDSDTEKNNDILSENAPVPHSEEEYVSGPEEEHVPHPEEDTASPVVRYVSPDIGQSEQSSVEQWQTPLTEQHLEPQIKRDEASDYEHEESLQSEPDEGSEIDHAESPYAHNVELPDTRREYDSQEESFLEQDDELYDEQENLATVTNRSDEELEDSTGIFDQPEESVPQHDISRSFSTIDQENISLAAQPSTDDLQMWSSSFVTDTTSAATPSPAATPFTSQASPHHIEKTSETPFTFQDIQQSTELSSSSQTFIDETHHLFTTDPSLDYPSLEDDQKHPSFGKDQTFMDEQSLNENPPVVQDQHLAEEREPSTERQYLEDQQFIESQPFAQEQHFTGSQTISEGQPITESQPLSEEPHFGGAPYLPEEYPLSADQNLVEEQSMIPDSSSSPTSFTEMLLQHPQPEARREEATNGELFIDILLKELDPEYTNSYPFLSDKLDLLLHNTPSIQAQEMIVCYLNTYYFGDNVVARPYITVSEQVEYLTTACWLLDRCLYERAVDYLKKACAPTVYDYKLMKTLEKAYGCQKAQKMLEEIESQHEPHLIFRPETWVRFLHETSLPAALAYIKTRIMSTRDREQHIHNIVDKLFNGPTIPTMLELKHLAMFEHDEDQYQRILSFAQGSDTLPAKAFMVCHYIQKREYGDAVLLNRKIQSDKSSTDVSEQEDEIYRECQVLEDKVYDTLPPIAREMPAEIVLFRPGEARPPYENYFRDNGIHAGAKLLGDVFFRRIEKLKAEKRAREDNDEGHECTKTRKL